MKGFRAAAARLSHQCAAMLVAFALLVATSQASEPVSVYQVDPRLDGAVIAVTGLGIAWPYANAEHLIHPRCPCDAGEVNGLDRGAIGNESAFGDAASDVTAGLAMAAPFVVSAIDQKLSRAFWEDAAVFAETLTVNGALVTLAKYTAQRPLPRTYAGDPSLIASPGGYRSFYSGHTSVTFAALSSLSYTLDRRYSLGAWPWVATGVLGASVAVERVVAGRHFPTDVALGAVAGTLVGVGVPWLHARELPVGGRVTLRPAPTGAQLVWIRPF